MKTLLKFEADWCGHCQKINPIVAAVLDGHQEVDLRVIDVDKEENAALVLQHGIRTIPAFILLDENENVLDTHRGSLSQGELELFIAA